MARIPGDVERQVIAVLAGIILAGLAAFNVHLQQDLERVINTQREQLTQIARVEVEEQRDHAAITNIDDRLRREVEIPAYCQGSRCP